MFRLLLVALAVFVSLAPPARSDQQLYQARYDPYHVHQAGCRLLRLGATPVTAAEATALTACAICKPTIAEAAPVALNDGGTGGPRLAPTATPTPAPVSKESSKSVTTTPSGSGTVFVKGYTRKDGTYVKSHTRKKPKPKK